VTDVSVCVAVYTPRPAPNAATLAAELPGALGGLDGELRVVLNGIPTAEAGVRDDDVVASFDVNRGVSVAWNAAAAQATGEVLCFCNDDVALGPRSLKVLSDALAAHPEAGIVSPGGAAWNTATLRYGKWVSTDELTPREVRPCDVVAGYLFAPCGMEEVDLSTAVRGRLGLECYAVGGVAHDHEYGVSAARPWRRIEFDGRSESLGSIHDRNKRHFAEKWGLEVPRFDRLRYFGEIVGLAIRRRLGR